MFRCKQGKKPAESSAGKSNAIRLVTLDSPHPNAAAGGQPNDQIAPGHRLSKGRLAYCKADILGKKAKVVPGKQPGKAKGQGAIFVLKNALPQPPLYRHGHQPKAKQAGNAENRGPVG